MLYVAMMREEKARVQIDEIAEKLDVPRHFLSKIMQQMVKAGLLRSTKGPFGGFSITERTLGTPLIRIVEITDRLDDLNICVMQLRNCNELNPCPLHSEMQEIRKKWLALLKDTTIEQLAGSKIKFITSLPA